MSVVVRRARLDEIFPLRHAVLRPGRPESASVYGEDPSAVHIGAWDASDEGRDVLVACATVFADPWKSPPAQPAAWRLRGMAVDPARHRSGIGRLVLAEVVAVGRDAGAPLMWANARVTALPFYEAHGWVVAGEEFIAADTGLPHKPIVYALGGQ